MNKENKSPEGTGIMACDSINSKVVNPECKQVYHSLKRLYVLVNKKLRPVYGCVQGGHAVAQWMINNPNQDWNNEYLIYLYADTDKWFNRLQKMGVRFSAFREPDLNYTITAIAVRDDSGELFKNLETVK